MLVDICATKPTKILHLHCWWQTQYHYANQPPLCVSVYYTEICHYMSTNYIVKGIGILPFNFPRTLLAVFLISAISSSNSSFISAETVNRISLFLLFYYFSFFPFCQYVTCEPLEICCHWISVNEIHICKQTHNNRQNLRQKTSWYLQTPSVSVPHLCTRYHLVIHKKYKYLDTGCKK